MMKSIAYAAGLGLALSLVCGLPVYAQIKTVTTGEAANSVQDLPGNDQAVTIFGFRTRGAQSSSTYTSIDSSRAASCNFNPITSGAQEVISGYMDDFYGTNRSSEETDINESPRFDANSAYGNAKNSDSRYDRADNASAVCGQSDRNFAIGRSYIARHDHSLQDAFAAFDAKEYPQALELFKKAYAKMGMDQAALMTGKMYLLGVGTSRDTPQAINWLRKVAEAPFNASKDTQPFHPDDAEYMSTRVEATMTLANIYRMGWDVAKNPAEAKRWYAKADEFGFIPATHIMGLVYENGFGTDKNITRAIPYLKKAGSVGYAPSQYELGVIYYNGAEGIKVDKKLAGAWLLAASKHGHPDALFAVGRMYDLGEGGAAIDPAKALIYYKEAAVKGQPDAQNAVGLSFYTGNGLPKDDTMARKWFQKAAEQGNPDGMFNLAVMLAHGEGGNADMALAYVWFKLASQSELEKAGPAAAELEAKLAPEDRAKAEAILKPKP